MYTPFHTVITCPDRGINAYQLNNNYWQNSNKLDSFNKQNDDCYINASQQTITTASIIHRDKQIQRYQISKLLQTIKTKNCRNFQLHTWFLALPYPKNGQNYQHARKGLFHALHRTPHVHLKRPKLKAPFWL